MACFWFDVGNLVEIIFPRSCWIFTELTLPRIDFQPASYWYSCYSFIHPHAFPSSFVWKPTIRTAFQSIDATGRTLTALVLASERCGRNFRGRRVQDVRMGGFNLTFFWGGSRNTLMKAHTETNTVYNWVVTWWFEIFFIFTSTWGRFPCWLIFFQRGWNHQLDNYTWFRIFTFEIIWTIIMWVEL